LGTQGRTMTSMATGRKGGKAEEAFEGGGQVLAPPRKKGQNTC
jgi:hypothetical protein